MSEPARSRIHEVLTRHEAEILAEWMNEQARASALRPDLIRETQLREQATTFLALLRAALEQGDLADTTSRAWTPVREFLADISASRTRQGFTPSETATFVFSLKRPLFARLERVVDGDSATLVREVMNASGLLDKLGLYTTEIYQKTRDDIIRRQQEELIELSTPVIKVWESVLVLPLIGTLDSRRTQVVMESLLQRIVETGSQMAIIDITGVPTVDTLTAQHLLKTVTATRLMGADCIISGISPAIAQMLVQLGVSLGDIQTKSTLASALAVALRATGRTVVDLKPRA